MSRPPSERTALLEQGDHNEPHFDHADVIRDIVLGLSDGLTVPFALAAGLSALNSTRIVVTAGFAELAAGAVSMGLGGYLAGTSEIEHYESERKREYWEVSHMPEREEEEIYEIFERYGLDRAALAPLVRGLKANPDKWVDFMMQFELCLEKPDASRSYISAATVGLSYLFGGLIPLLPYVFVSNVLLGLYISIGVTGLALLIFGFVKSRLLGVGTPFKSAFQTLFVGGAAAASAYALATLLPNE